MAITAEELANLAKELHKKRRKDIGDFRFGVSDDIFVELHGKGLTIAEIAEKVNVNYRSAQGRLKKLGLKPNRIGNRRAMWGQINDLYNQGMTQNEIANSLGLGEEFISHALEKLGLVPFRPQIQKRMAAPAVLRGQHKITTDELARELNEGISPVDIARKYNMTKQAIYQRMKRMGFNTKK